MACYYEAGKQSQFFKVLYIISINGFISFSLVRDTVYYDPPNRVSL